MDNKDRKINGEVATDLAEEKIRPEKKKRKAKVIRNQFLFKKGGYSVAVIALVVAALILLNWLVSTLGERFHLEIDMSPDKVSTMDSGNIEFLEGIKDKVTVTVCGAEDTYTSYMNSYAYNNYSISDGSDYFDQTITLIKKYNSYNKNITVEFIDPQTSEFSKISQKYPNADISYGEIIVSCEKGGNERYKKLGFSDIYELQTDDTYAAYGYSTSTLEGNKIETALTGAIAYCVSSKTAKVAVYTGHSATDYSEKYVELLKANNFEVDILTDKIISKIPAEYDVIAILAPTGDFIDSELTAISTFLENGGKLSKGLMYFADSACPSLPNLESFLKQWGIVIENGVLFETLENYRVGDPYTLYSFPEVGEYKSEGNELDDSMLSQMGICVTGYNVPMSIGKTSEAIIKANAVMSTLPSTVVAPVGADENWSDYKDDDAKQHQTVIEAKKADYDSENNAISSYVYAFSSIEYIQSEWAENERTSNKNLVLACSERAAGTDNTGVSFVTKTISNETFSESVTEGSVRIVRIVFIALIPLIMVALGVFVYIKRRNA